MKTWEHLVIFECEMHKPPKFKSKYRVETYKEWLTKFTFGKWMISDIDNFMMGNPLFLGEKNRELFSDSIFEDSKFDYKANIDLHRK